MFPKGRSLLRPAVGGPGAGSEARVAGGLYGPNRVEEAGVETEPPKAPARKETLTF